MLENLQAVAIEHSPRILGALAILLVGYLVARLIARGVRKVVAKTDIDDILISFLGNVVYAAVLAMAIIAALRQLGLETTSFTALVAAAGLAIGLSLQDSLGNFAAGFQIIILRPFRAGNFIEAAGVSGVVETISVFATTLRTVDNKEVIVPNGTITKSNIINYSARMRRRVDLIFSIGYDDDLKAAKELLEKLVAEDERIHSEPEPFIAVQELAASSVDLAVKTWVNTENYGAVRADLLERVKLAFDDAGISIPFPQQDIHLRRA